MEKLYFVLRIFFFSLFVARITGTEVVEKNKKSSFDYYMESEAQHRVGFLRIFTAVSAGCAVGYYGDRIIHFFDSRISKQKIELFRYACDVIILSTLLGTVLRKCIHCGLSLALNSVGAYEICPGCGFNIRANDMRVDYKECTGTCNIRPGLWKRMLSFEENCTGCRSGRVTSENTLTTLRAQHAYSRCPAFNIKNTSDRHTIRQVLDYLLKNKICYDIPSARGANSIIIRNLIKLNEILQMNHGFEVVVFTLFLIFSIPNSENIQTSAKSINDIGTIEILKNSFIRLSPLSAILSYLYSIEESENYRNMHVELPPNIIEKLDKIDWKAVEAEQGVHGQSFVWNPKNPQSPY